MGLAVNRRPLADGTKPKANFIEIVAWGKQAEACAAHLKKGSGIHVTGELRHETWEAKPEAGGGKRSKVYAVAHQVEFLPGAIRADGASEEAGDESTADEDANDREPAGVGVGEPPPPGDDIPF